MNGPVAVEDVILGGHLQLEGGPQGGHHPHVVEAGGLRRHLRLWGDHHQGVTTRGSPPGGHHQG
eukprot:8305492-Pyramimonas_sp.AAC.1